MNPTRSIAMVICCAALVVACDRRDSTIPQETPAKPQEKPADKKPEEKKDVPANPAKAGDEDAGIKKIKDFIAEKKIDTSKPSWKTSLPKPPVTTFTAGKKYFWNISTNKGDIKVLLKPDVAPMHASSTIYLATLGFYDDTKFHRVITGFMAQGGDPLGNGTGGPGYDYNGEFSAAVKHDKPGLLSMANRGPGTDGSQFFLTFVPTAWLDGKHTIFGEVTSGLDVLKKLEAAGSQSGATSEPLMLKKSTISVE